jgi:site-specific DNA-methyltransferase (adenine-specific)
MRGLPTSSVDLIITDPPYEIENLSEHFAEMVRILKPTGSLYVFGDKDMVAEHWYRQVQIKNKTLLIWYYKNSPKPRGRWRLSMQAIIYGHGAQAVFNEDAVRVEYTESAKKLNGRMRPSSGRMKESIPYDTSKGALPRDVLEHPALLGHLSRERVGHPDQKPIGLIERLVLASSVQGDLVFDPFAGSGTIGVAAKKLNRNFQGVEKNPKWVSVANDRLGSS